MKSKLNTTSNHTIIFSVSQSAESTANNFKAHMLAESLLKALRVSYKQLGGMYKGCPAMSFAVTVPFIDLEPVLGDIRRLASRYNQEAILYVDNERTAWVDDLMGGVDRLGKLVQVSKEEAEKQENYSLDLEANQYYIIK